jgi:hypothetical protein
MNTISIVAFFEGMSSSECVFDFLIFWTDISSCDFVQGLRLIYTGDSSVLTGHRAASKPSKAEKYSMREVTPESVAYVATQVSLFFSLPLFIHTFILYRYILVYVALNHGVQRTATSTLSDFTIFVGVSSRRILRMNG